MLLQDAGLVTTRMTLCLKALETPTHLPLGSWEKSIPNNMCIYSTHLAKSVLKVCIAPQNILDPFKRICELKAKVSLKNRRKMMWKMYGNPDLIQIVHLFSEKKTCLLTRNSYINSLFFQAKGLHWAPFTLPQSRHNNLRSSDLNDKKVKAVMVHVVVGFPHSLKPSSNDQGPGRTLGRTPKKICAPKYEGKIPFGSMVFRFDGGLCFFMYLLTKQN